MALLQTLQDTFGASSVDSTKWTNWGGSNVTESGGLQLLSSTGAGNYYGINSIATYDLTASYAESQLFDAGDQSIASLLVFPVLLQKDSNNKLVWYVGNGNVKIQKVVGGVTTDLVTFAYNPLIHRFFRIQESGGAVYWKYSSDGYTWTTKTSISTPFAVTALTVYIFIGTSGAESYTTTATVTNFNVVKSGTGIVLERNSIDISSSVELESLRVSLVLTKEVGRTQFRIKNYTGKAAVAVGDQIDVYDGTTHIFGGTVTEKQDEVMGGILIGSTFTANDWSFRLNSKLVVNRYENEDPQAIVDDIIWQFTDRGYSTTSVVLGGFDVPSVNFNYEQVTTSLEKLAKQIGWEWYVDADKVVHFFPPDVMVNAPYTIDDTSGNLEWATLNVDESIVNMKNSVYVIGGTYTKSLDATTTPDVYLTDGTKSVFTVAYPYTHDTIVVTLDGVVQTLGTDQVTDPLTVQVLYNEAERFIRFTTTATTGKTVKVYGDAQIPILAHVQNQQAVATYGEIQDVIIDQQIKSIEEAQDRGLAQIAQYGSPVYAVKFSTLKTGFAVGQTVQVDSTLFGQDVLVIVKRITAKMYSPTQLRYELECVGTERVSFVDIMKLLLIQSNAQTVVDDSTVLQVLKSFEETITGSDTLHAPTTTTPPYKWGPAAGSLTYNFGTWG